MTVPAARPKMPPRPAISGELSAVRAELGRVDSKCATLAGLAGAAAAFTATQAGHGPLAVRVITAVAALAFTAGVLALLVAVLRPRLGAYGFCLYAELTPGQIRALFSPGAFGGWAVTSAGKVSIERFPAEDLHVLSQITLRKYRGLRLAADFMAAGVTLLVAASLTGVIA